MGASLADVDNNNRKHGDSLCQEPDDFSPYL